MDIEGLEGLGERIATSRTSARLTQAQLARIIEVSQAELSRWERGRVEPRLGVLTKIAEACSVSIDWLVRGDHLPSVPTVEGAGEVRS
jgi:transcriptional regulator with XRE-family HTH domain